MDNKTTVRYRYAVVGFSTDLTDTKSPSIPVAVVGSGEADKHGFVFLIATTDPPVTDPVARDILARVPRFLREEMSASLNDSGAEGWLRSFSGRMSQSLYVTKISEEKIDIQIGNLQTLIDATLQQFQPMIISPFRKPPAGSRLGTAIPGAFMLEPITAGQKR